MISYTELFHLDVAAIKGAADQWDEYRRRYERMDEAYDQQVLKPFDEAGWSSFDVTSAVARAQVADANKEFTDAGIEAKGLRAVLEDAYEELKKCKADLHQLTEDAKKNGVLISETGQVSLKDPDKAGDERRGGGLLPTDNEVTVKLWEGSILLILTSATNADQSAAMALKRNTGQLDEGFNDKTVKSVDQDESQRASTLLKKYEKGEKLSPSELDELHRLMVHNNKDPEFSRMTIDSLGPEGTLRLAEDLQRDSQGDSANKSKYGDIQSALANNIGTANKDKEFSEQWRKDMRELGTQRLDDDGRKPYNYQLLTTLLKEGDSSSFPPHMTTGLTDDLIAAEKKKPDIWDEHQDIAPGDDAEKQEIVDPVDDMLGIMSGDPDTATKYLDPAQSGSKDNLKYLLDDRHWPNVHVTESVQNGTGATDGAVMDRYDEDSTNSRAGLGNLLEAATTGVEPGEERTDFSGHTEGQARVMQDTIARLDSDTKGDEIPENMRQPLARALSDYTPDTHDIIAGSKDGYDDERGRGSITGTGDDAHITNKEGSVIRVLRGVSEDPAAYAQVYESERFYAADQMDKASQNPGANNENWNVPAREASNVLGAYNAIGSDAYLDQRDEKKQWADDVAKQRYHQAGLPLTAIPYVGDGAQRMLDQTTYDWSKDVKAEADLQGKEGTEAEKAKGSAGTKDLVDQWVAERNRQGAGISDMTERDIKQQAEESYLVHRGSALGALRGEY